MPNNAPISFTTTGLPANYCFTTFSRLNLDIVGALLGYVQGNYNFFNFGDDCPDPDDRNKPWLRTISGFPDRWYVYVGGAWIWPNTTEASGIERRFLEGSDAAIWSYDGGDGTDPSTTLPTAITGAMWEVDTNYAGRVPVGAGTLPSGAVLAVGDSGGEDKHLLTIAELPEKCIPIQTRPQSGSQIYIQHDANNQHDEGVNEDTDLNIGGGEAHNNMQPYRAGRWCKRTARQYYSVVC